MYTSLNICSAISREVTRHKVTIHRFPVSYVTFPLKYLTPGSWQRVRLKKLNLILGLAFREGCANNNVTYRQQDNGLRNDIIITLVWGLRALYNPEITLCRIDPDSSATDLQYVPLKRWFRLTGCLISCPPRWKILRSRRFPSDLPLFLINSLTYFWKCNLGREIQDNADVCPALPFRSSQRSENFSTFPRQHRAVCMIASSEQFESEIYSSTLGKTEGWQCVTIAEPIILQPFFQ